MRCFDKKKMLYSKFDAYSLKYGRRHEKDAVDYLKSSEINVRPCGIIIDKEFPFLAASPDGPIEKAGIVKIKFPSSCVDITTDEAISSRKVTFWSYNKTTNEINVNKKHCITIKSKDNYIYLNEIIVYSFFGHLKEPKVKKLICCRRHI